ncbi:ferredoxin--NADP reductase [Paracidovorax anthurii]|uniref:Ferredoxin-NADP reductase n=1 Tax=Paracidovorax anthurii TaxID=78229 RepID=A0A328ZGS9_9BURK|nr:FAD-dependent oxidoreductase [Paracidovorax anthurii]RAR85131.1 ferredoxin-NADP reductase [Paracidovorax anthurii]
MTDPENFTVRVLARTPIAQDTMAFAIERPAGFDFEAGQYVSIQLPGFIAPEDGSDDGERMLSIASAPHDAGLLVAMRMRDTAFKRHLAACAVGEQGAPLHLSPPMGDFVLPADGLQPLVMIAGGIGITPFYSMLRHLQHRAEGGEAVPPVTLLYGNRSSALAAWSAEIDAMAAALPGLRVVHVLSEQGAAPAAAGGTPRSGLIDADTIRQEVADWRACRYYVVGPTAMVAAMQDCLDACEVPPEQVVIEFFAGY